jgi:hypothetical protein
MNHSKRSFDSIYNNQNNNTNHIQSHFSSQPQSFTISQEQQIDYYKRHLKQLQQAVWNELVREHVELKQSNPQTSLYVTPTSHTNNYTNHTNHTNKISHSTILTPNHRIIYQLKQQFHLLKRVCNNMNLNILHKQANNNPIPIQKDNNYLVIRSEFTQIITAFLQTVLEFEDPLQTLAIEVEEHKWTRTELIRQLKTHKKVMNESEEVFQEFTIVYLKVLALPEEVREAIIQVYQDIEKIRKRMKQVLILLGGIEVE